MHTAIYCRVSTGKQDNKSQEHELRAWLDAKGVIDSDTTWYRDHAISGTKRSRPAWDQLLGDIRSGSIGRVLVWKLDRMSRPEDPEAMFEFGLLVTALRKQGVPLLTVTEGEIRCDSHEEALMLMIRLFMAAMEREAFIQRTKAGVSAARAKGVRIGRPPKITGDLLARGKRLHQTGESIRAITRTLGGGSNEAWRYALTQ